MDYKQREKELLDFFQNQETRTKNAPTSQKSFTEVGGAGFNLITNVSQNGVSKALQFYNNFIIDAKNLLNKEPARLFKTPFKTPNYADLFLAAYGSHIEKDADVVFEANFQPYIKTKLNKKMGNEYKAHEYDDSYTGAAVELWRANDIITPCVTVTNKKYSVLDGMGQGDSMLWNVDSENKINGFFHRWENGCGDSCDFGEEVTIPPPSQFLCWDNELPIAEFLGQLNTDKKTFLKTIQEKGGIASFFKVVDINDPNLVIPLYKVIVSPKNKTIDINVNKELFDSSLQNTIKMSYPNTLMKNSEDFTKQIEKEVMSFVKYSLFVPNQESQKQIEDIKAKKKEIGCSAATSEQWELLEKQIEDIKVNQLSNDFKTKISYITTPENFDKTHPLPQQHQVSINQAASESKEMISDIQNHLKHISGVNKIDFEVIDLDTKKSATKTIKR